MARRVKLVCTLGPATATPERVRVLADAGTDVFRVNLSHGDPASHDEMIRIVRSVSDELAVMTDLPGPKIRLGDLDGGVVRLEAGSRFVLRPGGQGNEYGAATTYAGLASDLEPGDRVLLTDGAVELVVLMLDGPEVVTEVVRGGSIRSRTGVNVPAERLQLPAVTERDRDGLARVLDAGVDLVAQSFVRGAADVVHLRGLMGDRAVPIVAKIETRPAIEDIRAIVGQADAIMVARGDLGVELPMEEIPILQKELLRVARTAGTPAIVATQMLESMTHAPRPTRAEASDVANAVLDGADAIMLSGETAIGEFPVEAAETAARIAEVAEEHSGAFRLPPEPCSHEDEAAAVAHAAAQVAADDRGVAAIACYTSTGRTAALLSRERPGVPVHAFAPDIGIGRRSALRWGVRFHAMDIPVDTDQMVGLMDEGLREAGLAAVGDPVVMVASSPVGKSHTNMLKVHRIGNAVR